MDEKGIFLQLENLFNQAVKVFRPTSPHEANGIVPGRMMQHVQLPGLLSVELSALLAQANIPGKTDMKVEMRYVTASPQRGGEAGLALTGRDNYGARLSAASDPQFELVALMVMPTVSTPDYDKGAVRFIARPETRVIPDALGLISLARIAIGLTE